MDSIAMDYKKEEGRRNNDRRREKRKGKKMSEVGFEPTPTRVDCDLNAAP